MWVITRIEVNCAYVGREGIRTDGGIALLIPNVRSRLGGGWVLNFTPWLLYSLEKYPRYALHWRMGWSQRKPGCFDEEMNLLYLVRIEPRSQGSTSHSLVTHRLRNINHLTPKDLLRGRAVSPLKIKIPSKKISAGSVVRRDLIPALKG
jgi:hypothetical protein